jgi:6-phosphogluconolactonase (cycloisomerase 2 family)
MSGRLTMIQSQDSMGRTPRFFALDPSSRWLYVLNEDSDNIVNFEVRADVGTLSLTTHNIRCGSPVCMVFI